MDSPEIRSSNPPVNLWKDSWWIQLNFLTVTAVFSYWCYSILIRVLQNHCQMESVNDETSPLGLNKVSTSQDTTSIGGDEDKMDKIKVNYEAKTKVKENMPPQPEENTQFHDLVHHGIRFYNDNMSSLSNRERRPRMPSTVTESLLRNRISPTTPPTPAFPLRSQSDIRLGPIPNKFEPLEKNFKIRTKSNMETVIPPPIPPRLSKSNCRLDQDVKLERKESGVNTDISVDFPERYLVLHQYPAHIQNPNIVKSSANLENFMRLNNVNFTVIYDCSGPSGPWIVDESGMRIDGVKNCTNYIRERVHPKLTGNSAEDKKEPPLPPPVKVDSAIQCHEWHLNTTSPVECEVSKVSSFESFTKLEKGSQTKMLAYPILGENFFMDEGYEDMEKLSFASDDIMEPF